MFISEILSYSVYLVVKQHTFIRTLLDIKYSLIEVVLYPKTTFIKNPPQIKQAIKCKTL